MSLFKVEIVEVNETNPIEKSDFLATVNVKGWQCVVLKKGFMVLPTKAVYFPLDSTLPKDLIDFLELKLSGKKGNIVKSIRLRGALSQGLCIPLTAFGDRFDELNSFEIGHDLTDYFGVTKYEPPIPTELAGYAKRWPEGLRKYDIENIEYHLDALEEGETVAYIEKLEGTNVAFDLRLINNEWEYSVCSRGVAFNPSMNETNAYCRMSKKYSILERLKAFVEIYNSEPDAEPLRSITLRCEVIGPNIQGNIYELKELEIRAFELEFNDKPLGFLDFMGELAILNICYVGQEIILEAPILKITKFSKDDFRNISYGKSLLKSNKIREGAIIRVLDERSHPNLGRVILKAKDPEYLIKQKIVEE